jgi:hypothetical protein
MKKILFVLICISKGFSQDYISDIENIFPEKTPDSYSLRCILPFQASILTEVKEFKNEVRKYHFYSIIPMDSSVKEKALYINQCNICTNEKTVNSLNKESKKVIVPFKTSIMYFYKDGIVSAFKKFNTANYICYYVISTKTTKTIDEFIKEDFWFFETCKKSELKYLPKGRG